MGKTFFLIIAFSFSISHALGQYILDTPDGKRVQLNSNGTWAYLKVIPSSSSIPKSSTAKYISSNQKYAIWFDPTQWIYDTVKTSTGLSWDATFYSKDYAITGYCIDSRLAMPVDNLESFIRPQWSEAGKIASFVTFKDTINSLPVTGFDMLLEYGGVTYQYRGYIHTTQRGSFQFMLGSQKEIFEEDKNKIDQLFKGVSKL